MIAFNRYIELGVESGPPAPSVEKAAHALSAGFQAVKPATQRGIAVGAGTDSGGRGKPHGCLAGELELLVKAGLTARDAPEHESLTAGDTRCSLVLSADNTREHRSRRCAGAHGGYGPCALSPGVRAGRDAAVRRRDHLRLRGRQGNAGRRHGQDLADMPLPTARVIEIFASKTSCSTDPLRQARRPPRSDRAGRGRSVCTARAPWWSPSAHV